MLEPPSQDWRLRLPEARRRRLRLWFWSIAAMTFAVVVIGGITRLTHSGLSIVEWRPLMGVVPPLTDAQWTETFDRYKQFPEYLVLRPRMTLAEFKYIFFWEYLHRLVARAIGAVFLIPFILFWRAGYFARPLARRALVLFGLGAAQGAVGWLMVKSGLVDRPSVSHFRLALHFAVAVTIFACSVWLARDLAIRSPRPESRPGDRRSIRRWLVIVGVLLASQIVCAFVAGMKAGWLFGTFPLMAGRLVPPGWLALDPVILNFVQNPATVQWVHRLLGTVLLVSAFAFVRRLGAVAPDRTTRRLSVTLLQLIAFQYLLGVLTLVYFVPVPLAAAHQALALAIVAVWLILVHHVENLTEAPALDGCARRNRDQRLAPESAQAAASASSALRSTRRNPSFSVRTMRCLPQRLMMRIAVSMVVPVRSASSCRDSGIATNVPPSRACPTSPASFRNSRAKRGSTRLPVSSARRFVSSIRRWVSPSRSPRTRLGELSSRPKKADRSIAIQVVSSSATAEAGKGQPS